MAVIEDILKVQGCINIFGYGSLIWNPDVDYDCSYLGYISGYERRFWQGSTYHRGTLEQPGRVLTMTKVNEGRCWGRVFVIKGADKVRKALDSLQTREQQLGHYDIRIVPVHILETNDILYSVVYYATPENPLFLGESSLDEIAENIVQSCGVFGHNIEYLFRLTDFMRENLPEEKDEHLYALDKLVRSKIGLLAKNVLPWHKLLENDSFRKHIYDIKETNYNEEVSLKTIIVQAS
ncbi:glutathione-specific gamma-glutamylcyclotransferase 1 [Hydra vulgaris]|uniref:glutathione-specific gamma-glutamylcyclotransferase n=1 Tax=Hydra vulgaris TaxID=6087 RepID=T2M6H8_HYDVU|nr:glutathione-specific gamma-glutamylcyclotransferase 1 [Hydra vulgaris]